MRTQCLTVLPLKPGVGQYTAIHATLTAKDFFLISTFPVHSAAFFPQNLSRFFPVLAVVNTGCCVGPQTKTVTLLDAGFRVECPRNMNKLKKHDLWYDDL